MKKSRKLAWVVLGVVVVCMVLVLARRPVLEVICYREIINQLAAQSWKEDENFVDPDDDQTP